MNEENTYKTLLQNLKQLRTKEHNTLIELLVLLGEFDHKKYYRDAGYSSLFHFLVQGLNYSRSAAMRRMAAARTIRNYPKALELLKEYKVSLTTLTLVAKELDDNNYEEILRSISGKSRTEVEQYLATRGKPVVKRDQIKPIVSRVPKKVSSKSSTELPLFTKQEKTEVPPEEPTVDYLVSFKASAEFMDKLKEVQSLLLRKEAQPTLEKVFESALDSFLDNKSPRRRNARRKQHTKPTPKTLTPRIKDLVLQKSDYRCSYIAEDGTRCDATSFLEVDHITPKALGGSNSIENLRCLCSAHNKLEAEEVFGSSYMGQFYS